MNNIKMTDKELVELYLHIKHLILSAPIEITFSKEAGEIFKLLTPIREHYEGLVDVYMMRKSVEYMGDILNVTNKTN